MKIRAIALLLLAALLTGCAGLSVHVDLYQGPHVSPANPGAHIQALTQEVARVEAAYAGFSRGHRGAVAAILSTITAEAEHVAKALRKSPKARELLEEAEALKNSADVYRSELEDLGRFDQLVRTHVQKVEQALAASGDCWRQAERSRNPVLRLEREGQAQAELLEAMTAARLLVRVLEFEFSPVPPDDERPRKLLPAEDLRAAARAELGELTENRLVLGEETQALDEKAQRLFRLVDPDLEVDDSDPMYLAMDSEWVWHKDFFVQSVDADGNSDFLIVRHTPVRFSIARATMDPNVLVDAQLRLAQTGLSALGEVMRAAGAAYGIPIPRQETAEDVASGSDQQTAPVQTSLEFIAEASQRLTRAFRAELSLLETRFTALEQEASRIGPQVEALTREVEADTRRLNQLDAVLAELESGGPIAGEDDPPWLRLFQGDWDAMAAKRPAWAKQLSARKAELTRHEEHMARLNAAAVTFYEGRIKPVLSCYVELLRDLANSPGNTRNPGT